MPDKDDRIRCRYCGSNNFAGTVTCWQCNRSLLISQKPAESQPVPAPMNAVETWPDKPSIPSMASVASIPSFNSGIDYSTADKAAIAMGLLFPFIGYPLGIAFMMLDDARKTQLGRALLLWSTIGSIIAIVGTMMFIGTLGGLASKLMPSSGAGSQIQKLMPSDDGS
jgi:hypothetical protein